MDLLGVVDEVEDSIGHNYIGEKYKKAGLGPWICLASWMKSKTRALLLAPPSFITYCLYTYGLYSYGLYADGLYDYAFMVMAI